MGRWFFFLICTYVLEIHLRIEEDEIMQRNEEKTLDDADFFEGIRKQWEKLDEKRRLEDSLIEQGKYHLLDKVDEMLTEESMQDDFELLDNEDGNKEQDYMREDYYEDILESSESENPDSDDGFLIVLNDEEKGQ